MKLRRLQDIRRNRRRRGGLRLTAPALGLAALLLWSCGGSRTPAPLVDLDASGLASGRLSSWANAGTLGGEFSAGEAGPVVENVAGRKAAVFSGKGDHLRSSFSAPAALTGTAPFTVEAWVRDAEAAGREVYLSWAPRPGGSAEFGLGKSREAAFACQGAVKAGYEGGVPVPGAWHHLAVTSDGRAVRVYVDGDLNAETSAAPDIRAGGSIIAGAGWNGDRDAPLSPFSGAIASLRIHGRALTAREIRNGMGLRAAFAPAPGNGARVDDLKATFTWEAGDPGAKTYNVYFGDEAAVRPSESGGPVAQVPVRVEAPLFGIAGLLPGRTYYWRVDTLGRRDRVSARGDVWSFTVDRFEAASPVPRDGTPGVGAGLAELRWIPGRYAERQDVFFGTSAAAVAEGARPIVSGLRGDAGTCPLPAGPLEFGKTYYWRVAAQNDPIPPSPGAVWSFRTEDEPDPDDVTFFLGSDLHYGVSVSVREANRRAIDLMNALPGTPYPPDVGGVVRTPRGVILSGDLLEDGGAADAPAIWADFVEDFGLRGGDGRLAYPVYEGAGNHDGGPGAPVRAGIRARNPDRVGIGRVSENGLHYAWDWGRVRFVHLNLFAGGAGVDIINRWGTTFEGDWKFPEHSLEFLVEDLAANVGRSGRPVVLVQHYGWDEWGLDWWAEEERAALAAAIKGYNVAAAFWGHTHDFLRLDAGGIPTFQVGSTQRDPEPGVFTVVRLRPRELVVVERRPDGWGEAHKVRLR